MPLPPEGHASPPPGLLIRGLWSRVSEGSGLTGGREMVAVIMVTPQTASLLGSCRRCRSGLRECPFYRWAHRGQVTLRNPPRGPGWWWECLQILGAAELRPPSCMGCGSAGSPGSAGALLPAPPCACDSPPRLTWQTAVGEWGAALSRSSHWPRGIMGQDDVITPGGGGRMG